MSVISLKHGQEGVLSLRCFLAAALVFCATFSASAGEESEFTIPIVSKSSTSQTIQMRFVGSNPSPIAEKLFEYVDREGAFADGPRGTTPRAHRTVFRQVYPGVDLMSYSRRGSIQYDLIVAPGADPSLIRIVYEGFENVELYAELPGYQVKGGNKTDVPVIMEKTQQAYYRLLVNSYDPSVDLVIPTTSVPITARTRSFAKAR